ncbi:Cation-dependent mannose-6-phosphate receptor [Frankliniella fusca]|uniref:Cation-dependent mannose-6-phosphate receptor n=1 Tax=Frankliniella fusca TaxID=407009 RepID=A0AAE1HDV6_9NEOP|nr:Cation-dependent mannose-6-phosphate receptor [Frankliniella fusca]
MSIKTVVRFATFLYWLTSVVCTSQYCDHIFHSSDWQQARILHGLTDVGLSTESYITGYKTNYTVGVCGSVSRTDSLAAVLQNGTVVLGRVNNTNVVKGGDWMMMTFGSGDFYPENSNCSGARAAFVIINCNHNFSEENSLRFIKEVVQEEKDKKNSCFFFLEIHSQLVCIKPENIGGGTIFSILLLLLILGYIVGGTLYRRYILGAKGLEQIPNYTFWKTMKSKIQGVCSNVFCPRDSRNTSSWENLGARLERDDDSLLPP